MIKLIDKQRDNNELVIRYHMGNHTAVMISAYKIS